MLQAALRERIELFTDLADEFCLPLASRDVTPIRYIPLGLPAVAQDVMRDLLADGHYTNLGTFPAVPMKHAGVRVTLTCTTRSTTSAALVDVAGRARPGRAGARRRGGPAAPREDRRRTPRR